MDPKPKRNHQLYISILRGMTPEQRLRKAFELTEFPRRLLREGLRNRFPDLSEAELHELYLSRIERCHTRTF